MTIASRAIVIWNGMGQIVLFLSTFYVLPDAE